jgi:hypothetical protein
LDDSPFLAVLALLVTLTEGSVLVLAVALSRAIVSDISGAGGAGGTIVPSEADMLTGDSTVSSALHNFPKQPTTMSRHGYIEVGIKWNKILKKKSIQPITPYTQLTYTLHYLLFLQYSPIITMVSQAVYVEIAKS